MSRIIHRNSSPLPVAIKGEGSFIVDQEGRRYFDASGGAAVSCLGHAHPEVRAAAAAQLDALEYAHTSFFTTPAAEELAELLAANSPAGLGNVYFVSGGSEAVETALKMARQYHVERGEPGRYRYIARRQSYHGNTLAALSVGGNAGRRALYQPVLIESHHVSPCFALHYREAGESDEQYTDRLAAELDAEILRLGPDTVSAFIAETVVGATAGTVAPVPGYFRKIRQVCDRHGVLLILDEVMCGLGRTGSYHAFEQEGVTPDLLTLAKGLGGGYVPIGAVLAARLERHPHVADIRGRGMFWSVELAEDPGSLRAFAPQRRLHARIKTQARELGLLCYPGGGTIDGKLGDHVLLAPPYLSTADELAFAVDALARAIDLALADDTP